MFVDQIASQFRLFIDEDDTTFVTDAHVATMLASAYERFRTMVLRIAPRAYQNNVTISPAADNYDLSTAAVIILGSGVLTAARLVSLLEVLDIDGSGNINFAYSPASSLTELRRRADAYLLDGTVLRFSSDRSGNTIRLHYVPVDSVDWTQQTSGDNEFVDDFESFHDLIALLATEQWAIRDGGMNPKLDQQIAQRTRELELYLSRLSPGAFNHVGRGPRGLIV